MSAERVICCLVLCAASGCLDRSYLEVEERDAVEVCHQRDSVRLSAGTCLSFCIEEVEAECVLVEQPDGVLRADYSIVTYTRREREGACPPACMEVGVECVGAVEGTLALDVDGMRVGLDPGACASL